MNEDRPKLKRLTADDVAQLVEWQRQRARWAWAKSYGLLLLCAVLLATTVAAVYLYAPR